MNGAEIFIAYLLILVGCFKPDLGIAGCEPPIAVNGFSSREAARQTIEPDVDHRSGVKRQQLADQQSADDADAQRLTQFRTGSAAQGQRQSRRTARPSSSS